MDQISLGVYKVAREHKAAKEVPKFTKEQILSSKTLSINKDVAAAVLEDGKAYSIQEAETLVSGYLKRKV